MSSPPKSPGGRKSRGSAQVGDGGFLGCLAALGLVALLSLGISAVVQWAPGEIDRHHLGRPYVTAYYLLLLLAVALIRVRRYHKRGQTIREGLGADRAQHRHQRELRQRARQAPADLPWLTDRQRSPADWPGVVITPAPEVPGYYRGGYDVVLDSAGQTKVRVIGQVQKLTGMPLATARLLVDEAPVAVLRVPDAVMASAAKALLEYAGATVSVTDPAESCA
jgi:hypothetical protein